LTKVAFHYFRKMRVFGIIQLFITVVLCLLISTVHSFVPIQNHSLKSNGVSINNVPTSAISKVSTPTVFDRQRRSVANIQMMGLFGLGAPEIAVILVAAAFLLGPQKLAELGKDAGKIAGELKEVPKEFQAGLKEGEQAAQLAKKQEGEKQLIPDATIEEKKD
jgi:sec-independent protein translocase protein TatA